MDPSFFDFSLLHKQLQTLMREELSTLREVFDLMKEEEHHHIQSNLTSKKIICEKKTEINKRLKHLQKARSDITKTLGQTYFTTAKTTHFNSVFFNKIIEKDEENSLETFHLRDQILHFMKIIRQQKQRLVCLKKHTEASQLSLQLEPIKPMKKQYPKTQTIYIDSPTDAT